jgi:hypothetical protein
VGSVSGAEFLKGPRTGEYLTHRADCTMIAAVRNLLRERPISAQLFPKWTNKLRYVAAAVILIAPVYVGGLVLYGFSPEATDVGYAPEQPIPYSHALHAGELGIDCRYCHIGVETTAHATIPPTQTCINCHSQEYGIRRDSSKLTLLHTAFYGTESPESAGKPIPWVRVHDLPDYAYFNHSAHVSRGVGCLSCHGRVDRMEVVFQAEPLSMGWCLECHRNPTPHLRPLDKITDMTWTPEQDGTDQAALYEQYNIRGIEYMQSCSTCHR